MIVLGQVSFDEWTSCVHFVLPPIHPGNSKHSKRSIKDFLASERGLARKLHLMSETERQVSSTKHMPHFHIITCCRLY